MIEPTDYETALYWWSMAVRLAANEENICTVAATAAQAAIYVAAQKEPEFHGPATLRALGWMSIREATGGEELPEEEWRYLFESTGFDVEAVKAEARKILGAPSAAHHLN